MNLSAVAISKQLAAVHIVDSRAARRSSSVPRGSTVKAFNDHEGLRKTSVNFSGILSTADALRCTVARQVSSKPASSSGNRLIVTSVFERFTERAINSVMHAQREAKALGRKTVAAELLLLGLMVEDKGGSGESTKGGSGFMGTGISHEVAREMTKAMMADGSLPAQEKSDRDASEIPFSVGSKRVFEAALEESKKLRHNFISPEHLLVALVAHDYDGVFKLLERLGVRRQSLVETALARLKGELANEGRSTASLSSSQPSSSTARPAASASKTPAFSSASTSQGRSAGRKGQSALDDFCADLTALAVQGSIDPVIGREKEVNRVVEILARRTKNNPILLGEPGVGKTAIAEGLALRIAENAVPAFLQGKRVMSLDLGRLLAGAKERGELETRVTSLVSETIAAKDVILVIDEVHSMVGSGAVGRGGSGPGSGLDISNLLKPALARGQLQCIATTTLREYRKHVEKDKALARRFQQVVVPEPSPEDALAILRGLRRLYEEHHKCHISDDALLAAVQLSSRYIQDRYLPDKAIDLVDEAASRAAMDGSKRKRQKEASVLHKGVGEYWKEIRAASSAHEALHTRQSAFGSLTAFLSPSSSTSSTSSNVTTAADAAAAASPSRGATTTTVDDPVWSSGTGLPPLVVGPEDIAAVASQWTNIPLQQITASEARQLDGLEDALHSRVVGQDEGVRAVARAVKRSRVGLADPKRPITSMFLCGPTGVGKTELCKALAQHYFGTEEAMIRLDMSEYMERHAVSKLIGSPPGYVGFGDGGKLTEAVRRRPFTVLLLDEIEKAHPDVFNLLLQILEDGRLTDSQGRVVSFKNTMLLMTSNVGSQIIAKGGANRIGFMLPGEGGEGEARYSMLKSTVMEELKGHFRPEFLNRIDEIVVFRSLERSQVRAIVDMLLAQLSRRIALERGLNLEVSEALIAKICTDGYDRSMGARPLRRAIMSLLEDPISEAILLSSSSSFARKGSKSGGDDGGDEIESTAADKDANSDAELSGGSAVLSSIAIEEGEGGEGALAAPPMSLATSTSGKDSGEYRDGDTIFADVAEDGSTVVTRMPRPDLCDHGLCLPVLKLPAHVSVGFHQPD